MFAVLVVELNEALSCRLAAVANGRFERTNGSERECCKEDDNSRKDKKKNLYIYTKSSVFFLFFFFLNSRCPIKKVYKLYSIVTYTYLNMFVYLYIYMYHPGCKL